MHNHNYGCNHQLEYCGHCDVVYCKKCNKEWKYNFYNYVYPWQYTTSCGATGNLSAGGTTTETVTYDTKITNSCMHH